MLGVLAAVVAAIGFSGAVISTSEADIVPDMKTPSYFTEPCTPVVEDIHKVDIDAFE